MNDHSLKSLFLAPRSVAFVGLPRKSGPGSLNPVDNLNAWAYPGKIHLVHPHVSEIAGISTVGRISEVKEPVDLAVISTPRETIPGIIRECAEMNIRAVIVTIQGFAEADSRGAEIQAEMIAEARQGGIRILGPNTLGVYNAFDRFNSSFMPLDRDESSTAVVCQSGLFYVGAIQVVGGVGLGVDIGNGSDLNVVDGLEWVGNDPRVRVVALHAEGIPDGPRFLETARKVSLRVPIVALKTGRSPAGARAAASHSGALAGEDRIANAAMLQAGVIRVNETEQMFDLVRGFSMLPPMRGRRIGVVTLTGAGGILVLDEMDLWGLEPASLSEATLERVQGLTPHWMPLSNPVDIWPALMKHGMKRVYRMILEDVLRDPQVDAVICFALGMRPADRPHLGAVEVIQELSHTAEKPIITWVYGQDYREVARDLEEKGRSMAIPTLERGIRVLARMAQYEEWKRKMHAT